jgi:hypothetical protein
MKTTDIFSEDMDLKPHTYNERPDHEVQMARSDLYKAGKYAIELHNMLKRVGEQQGLEGWVQAKITKAADYLESVYHYLDYEMKNPSSNLEMEAAPVTPGSTPPGQTVTPANSSSRSSAVVPGTKIAQPTPGMVTMSKVDSSGRTQGMPVKVPQSQIMMKQQQGLKVIGDSKINKKKPVGETISAGSVAAVAGANGMGMGKKEIGSLFGGTFKQDEAANAAQRAATAIAKKKSGKYDKDGDRIREGGDTGPKFTGYYKGTDKGKPGKKMVGDA